MSEKITPKMGLFVARYLIHGNATLAAKEAGYAGASAHVTGAKLLKNAKVAAAIAERKARQNERLELTADKVLRELMKCAIWDIRDLYDEAGNLRAITDLDEITRAAIAGIDVETREVEVTGLAGTFARSVTRKFKMVDKVRALELLGKNQKLFTDKHEIEGKLTLEELVGGAA